MGWVSGITMSIIWNLLNLWHMLPQLGANPTTDVIVKGIIGGFLIIVAKEVMPF